MWDIFKKKPKAIGDNELMQLAFDRLDTTSLQMLAAAKGHKSASEGIVPYFHSERAASLLEWSQGIEFAKNPHMYNRKQLYRTYDNAYRDLHLTGIIGTRITSLQNSKFKVTRELRQDTGAEDLFKNMWFRGYIRDMAMSIFDGYTLAEITEFNDQLTTVSIGNKNLQIREISEISRVNKSHVRPELNKWFAYDYDTASAGFDYTAAPDNLYYIGIGERKDLGLMERITPIALAKRYAQATWGSFNDKLAVPFRTVTMNGQDVKRERKLAEILDKMGAAGWGILHPGEELKFIEVSKSDVHKCFAELMAYCDSQMSISVLHQTGTTNEKSYAGSAAVHQSVAEEVHAADRAFLEYNVNTQLMPRLLAHGYPLHGFKFERDDKTQIPLLDQIKIDDTLMRHYHVSPEYVANKYDVPIEFITEKSSTGGGEAVLKPVNNITDVVEQVAAKKTGKMYYAMPAMYSQKPMSAIMRTEYPVTMASDNTPEFKGLGGLIQKIFDGKAQKIDPDLWQYINDALIEVANEGVGVDLLSVDYTKPDNQLLQFMRDNIFLFSSAKTWQQMREMSQLLYDENGQVRSESEFKRLAKGTHNMYVQYLSVERNTALASGQMFQMWQDFAANTDAYPNLRYETAGDKRVRPSHQELEGIVLPFNDSFWDTYWPQNDWGCRCRVTQTRDKATDKATIVQPTISPIFANNVGKSGIIFKEDAHPYFDVTRSQMNDIKAFTNDKLKI